MMLFKKILGVVLGVTLLFAACSKSSDPAANNNSGTPTVVGTWNETLFSETECTNAPSNVVEQSCASQCWTFTFASDNTFSWKTSTSPVAPLQGGTYVLSGDQLTISYTDNLGSYVQPFTYTLTATSLKLVKVLGPAYPGCKDNFFFAKQ